MSKYHSFYDTVNTLAGDGVERGILQLYAEDASLENDLNVTLKGKKVVNFGSCSYLGLEFDGRLKEGAINAIGRYGTQFSSARIYLSLGIYSQLEEQCSAIFNANALVAPTTTLAHIATIPVLFRDDDAIILDHQVHNTVQNAVNLMKPRGTYVEMIRHNNMDALEERIKELRQKYRRIWYMADGVFSMYGDMSPIDRVYKLMDQYPELHYYVDDAHGMSCFGKHGAGYLLSKKSLHEKIILVTSFAKAFASGGAVIVLDNKEWATKIRNTGAPFLSSGPMQPASLGAALASAQIHLSDEIYSLQEDLRENILYTNLMLKKYGMPLVAENESPIFFVGVSLPKMGYNLIRRLLNEGFYTNLGVFPTVPIKNTGVRFTITRLHTFAQIESLVAAMAHHYPLALEEESFTMEKVYRAFKMVPPEKLNMEIKMQALVRQSTLNIIHEKTIVNIEKSEWDSCLGDRGTFDWNGMEFLENVFCNNALPENNWDFDYLIIKDYDDKPILATFLTTALAKDDMLSLTEISQQIEEKRLKEDDPYYFTSKTLILGSLLTEGNHLFIDNNSPYRKDALQILYEKIAAIQESNKAAVVILRDFESENKELDAIMLENGYFKINMPENNVLDLNAWDTGEEFLTQLSSRSRRHIRQEVIKFERCYETVVTKTHNNENISYLYDLYLNIKNNNLTLNTFTLPYKLFEYISGNENWEVLELYLNPDSDKREQRKPIAVVFSYKGHSTYNPIIVGLDYTFNREFNCYRQAIYQVILRAKALGKTTIRLGFSASIEKRKFGAKVIPTIAYMQAKDNYNMEALGAINALISGKNKKTEYQNS